MGKGSEPNVVDKRIQNEALHAALESFQARHAKEVSSEGLHAGSPAHVVRLDRPGAYLLIPILDPKGLRGIVQLDAQSMAVESSAAVRDPASDFLMSADSALAVAQAALPGKRNWRAPFLGWRPCRESQNSMWPLWVVPHAVGEVYVTQSGEVFEILTAGRGG
jgi:hypothetical protein